MGGLFPDTVYDEQVLFLPYFPKKNIRITYFSNATGSGLGVTGSC